MKLKKPVTCARSQNASLEKRLENQYQLVSWLARCLSFEWFLHHWSVRGDSVYVDFTRVVVHLFIPSRAQKKRAQLPHRESAKSSVADHLLQDLPLSARCAPSMQLRVRTLTLWKLSGHIWNIRMRCESKSAFSVLTDRASLRDVPFSSSENWHFFFKLPSFKFFPR